VGNAIYLDLPLTNGDPDAVLLVIQHWNAEVGGVYNQDETPIPDGAAFSVAVSGGADKPAR